MLSNEDLKLKQLRINARKPFILKKLPPIGNALGGAAFNKEGKLEIFPQIRRVDYTVLFSARRDRMVREVDDKGNRFVVDLSEIPLIEQNKFFNVQTDNMLKRVLRDDLVEPDGTSVNIKVYRTDMVFESEPGPSVLKQHFCFYPEDVPEWQWPGNDKATYEAAKAAGVDVWAVVKHFEKHDYERGTDILKVYEEYQAELGSRSGMRAPITDFTEKSRNKLKFTLRNALCDWTTMVTLTYPSNYPRDGRVCKTHLNRFLTHIRSDYKGIKYVWFMEFQERGAPHFHIFTTCALPGQTYVSPLWYHIVNSGDQSHLKAGTQVKPLDDSKKALEYATSYANKATQKLTPEEFKNVGRFWGSSRGLTSEIVTLSDISIRQMQHIRRHYLESFGVRGRLDRMNCYFWNGAQWAANVCHDYYNMHIRPFEAEMLDIGEVNPSLREKGAPWLEEHDKDRALGSKKHARLSKEAFPPSTGLDALRYLTRKAEYRGSDERPWRNLKVGNFNYQMYGARAKVLELDDREKPIHGLASSYGVRSKEPVSEEAFESSEITVPEWSAILGHLSKRMKVN
jgi:hypothetical protein